MSKEGPVRQGGELPRRSAREIVGSMPKVVEANASIKAIIERARRKMNITPRMRREAEANARRDGNLD